MAARKVISHKKGVRCTSRWPFSRDLSFYNNGEQCRLPSDSELKCYKQVCELFKHYTYFSCILCAFRHVFRYNSCVFAYNAGRQCHMLSSAAYSMFWCQQGIDDDTMVPEGYDLFLDASYLPMMGTP